MTTAVRFAAASDRISRSATPFPDPATGFTLCAWVYQSADRDDFSTIARLSANDGASTTANLATHSSGTTLGYLSPGGSLVSGHALSVGSWSRTAIAATSTSGKIFGAPPTGPVNVVSGTVGGAASPTMLTVGGRSIGDSTEWFNGRVAYLRLWNIELTLTELEAEWASPVVVRTANLREDYPLINAGNLNDISGNGHHLSYGTTILTTEDGPPVVGGSTGSGKFLFFFE